MSVTTTWLLPHGRIPRHSGSSTSVIAWRCFGTSGRGARSDDDAGELTAIVFERALHAIPRYRPAGGGFVAWLIRIARNASIDTHRRATAVQFADDLTDASSTGPEEDVLAHEARASLLASVGDLPRIQREAIVLRYAAGLTAREIGEVLGKTDQATQKLLSRALATLRETYRDDI